MNMPNSTMQDEGFSIESTSGNMPGFKGPLITVVMVAIICVGAWKMLGGPSEVLAGWAHSLDEGFEEAATNGKPVLVYYTADWCPPCKMLKKETLTRPEVADYLRDKFVLVKIDLTDRGGPNTVIAQANDVQGIPALFIYDSEGLQIDRQTGFMDEATFMNWASRSLTHIR